MILNPFKCEKCGTPLQPEDLLVGLNDEGELIRKCAFCGNEVNVEGGEK